MESREDISKEGVYEYAPPATSPFYNLVISPLCASLCPLVPSSVTPNTISVAGLLFAVASVLCAERERWFEAAGLWVCYSFCDNLDGKLARYRKVSSFVGEFLDHFIDSITSSLLGLLIIKALTPVCHEQSGFELTSLSSYAHGRGPAYLQCYMLLSIVCQVSIFLSSPGHAPM